MDSSLFKSFSKKQVRVMNWWLGGSKESSCDAIICDGAVRSGKTVCLSLSFVLWSFARFSGEDFALCGKTIKALLRNLVRPLMSSLEVMGFRCRLVLSRNVLEISFNGVANRYHLFGGKDEGSAPLIQGITLAGVLFDEVALMPRSFVEQAVARCSVNGAKFWFNCNPEHPSHWFYRTWIKGANEKNAFYLHFKMEDNPSLSPAVINRYKKLYDGVFYQRYIEGNWVTSYGGVYPMFSATKHVVESVPSKLSRYVISCDYGTVNPASFGLWGYHADEDVWYRCREYYHSSAETGVVMTDRQYLNELKRLAFGKEIETVIVDPSAASFIAAIREDGKLAVTRGKNNISEGIQLVSTMLTEEKIRIHKSCSDAINEFSLYRWDMSRAKDVPLQKNDHAMDDIRYFAMYAFSKDMENGFYATATQRK